MKKIIASFLIVLMVFNFIFTNHYVYADDDTDEKKSVYTDSAPQSDTATSDILEEGSVSQKQDSGTKTTLAIGSAGLSAIGAVTGLLARLINALILQVDVIMGVMTATEENGGKAAGGTDQFWFSIERTVFNRVALFNINYFNVNSSYDVDEYGNPKYMDGETEVPGNPTYKVGDLEITSNTTNNMVKVSIKNVYFICRLLATILSLLVLIYIGIRMALSTVASDQAKYKKMLVSWVESVILIFVMPYIMEIVFTFGEAITNIFYKIEQSLINSGSGLGVFEDTIRATTWEMVFSTAGLELTKWSIIYWCLLFMEIKFFWLYAKRLLMVGLLIIISPLITITYSIDKVGDGRAQVFAIWMKEFIVNVLIQPLHALIYLIFVLTANSIAQRSPLVALALLMSMGTVERMVKIIFDMRITTLRGVNKFLKKGE